MKEIEVRFTQTATKHGVSEKEIIFALNHIVEYDETEGLYVCDAIDGTLCEIAFRKLGDGTIYVYHAWMYK